MYDESGELFEEGEEDIELNDLDEFADDLPEEEGELQDLGLYEFVDEIPEDEEEVSGVPRGHGYVVVNGTRYNCVLEPIFSSLDKALQVALKTRGNILIMGNMLSPIHGRRMGFQLFRWGFQKLPTPPVIEFHGSSQACALTFNRGSAAYFPSNPFKPNPRWVKIPRLKDFYRLPKVDQDVERKQWIWRIRRPINGFTGRKYTTSQLRVLSTPALRLLLAYFASFRYALSSIRVYTGIKGRRGSQAHGATSPILSYPISEPECYLRVISRQEGRMETINAWDPGAGISLGPIQFNVNGFSRHLPRGMLFVFLWKLWQKDRHLFNQEFGRPLRWSMRRHSDPKYGNHPDLVINAGKRNEVVLHGHAWAARRNYRFFQSGRPGGRGFNLAFRRRVTKRFRNVVVWPHVQEMMIEVSVEWLSAGLRFIHRSGIPPLNPNRPDRYTFILKALLLSAWVRAPSKMLPLLQSIRRWSSIRSKLRNLRNALRRSGISSGWKTILLRRLYSQRKHAISVYKEIERLYRHVAAQARARAPRAMVRTRSRGQRP